MPIGLILDEPTEKEFTDAFVKINGMMSDQKYKKEKEKDETEVEDWENRTEGRLDRQGKDIFIVWKKVEKLEKEMRRLVDNEERFQKRIVELEKWNEALKVYFYSVEMENNGQVKLEEMEDKKVITSKDIKEVTKTLRHSDWQQHPFIQNNWNIEFIDFMSEFIKKIIVKDEKEEDKK